jgi:hypothetical protein
MFSHNGRPQRSASKTQRDAIHMDMRRVPDATKVVRKTDSLSFDCFAYVVRSDRIGQQQSPIRRYNPNPSRKAMRRANNHATEWV